MLQSIRLAFLFLICATLPFSRLSAQEAFVESSAQLNLDFNAGNDVPGGGISFVDFTGDGFDDLTIASSAGMPMGFYANDGQGSFTKVDFGLTGGQLNIKQVLWNDFDNDGDLDLFLTSRFNRNFLYENLGDLNFQDITDEAGLLFGVQENFGAAWGDYDRDGFLDLFLNVRPSGHVDFYSTNRNLHCL